MLRVIAFGDALRVVENGKQGHDVRTGARFRGQSASIFENTRPMRDAVAARQRQAVLVENCFQKRPYVQGRPRFLALVIFTGQVTAFNTSTASADPSDCRSR